MNTVKQRISRSVDRSSSSEIYSSSRSRSASDSRLSSQYNSKSTSLDPLYGSSLEVSANRETLKYNGICTTQDYYTKVLGPTVDETILVGLQMLIKLGFALPNCTAPPPKHELPSPESSADIASQTESSETKSETSQTPHVSEETIGYSEEMYAVDYEKSLSTPSTKSESLEPESTSNESVTTLSSTITSEELITEPTKVDTELLPVPIPTEIFEEEEQEEEEFIVNEIKEPTPNESENLKEEISMVPEEPIEEKPEEPIEQIPEEPIEVKREEPIEVKPEEPIEETPEEPIEEKPEEPIEETPEEPIEEKPVKPIEETPEEPIEETPEEPIEETPEEPIEEIILLQEIVEEQVEEKTEEESVEPLSEITEEFPTTEGESTNDDVTRLASIVKNTYQESQDDTETSEIPTVLTPVQESSVIENRNSRSKFSEKTIAATATYANHDRPELDTEDSKRSRTSIISNSFSTKHYENDKMSDTESEIEAKGSKQSRRGSTNSKQKSPSRESSASKKSKDKKSRISVSKSEQKSLEKSDSSSKKERRNSSQQKTQIKENGSSTNSKKSRDKHKQKQETIQEVTETDITEDTDPSVSSRTMDRTSRSSSVDSEYDTSEEKGNGKVSKADKSSSTPSTILKSTTTSSKSKESSTDSYICACHIQTENDERKCICPPSYCPRCDAKKTPLIVTCPFIKTCKKTEVPRNGACTCLYGNAIVNETQNQNPKYICESCATEDKKLLCDCYTSTSSTGYTSGSDSCGNMQRGDCATKSNVRYAITKITEYGKFTTFEVMKSTKKVPKYIPKSLEGVFVLKHKS